MYQIDHFSAEPEHRPKLLSERPTFDPTALLKDCQIGAWTEIGPGCSLFEMQFGDYSYAADNVSIIYSTIGRFCSIASHVRINPGNHPIERVTQHHMTYRRSRYGFAERDDLEFFNWRQVHACQVGHDVWIGHAATIMPGVSIDTGAVVGSSAVITKDVAPYQIVVGVPAKPLRMRFEPAVVERLLATAWWEWDRPTLIERFADLADVPTFIEKYG